MSKKILKYFFNAFKKKLEQWHKLVSLQDEIRGFVEVPTTPARN